MPVVEEDGPLALKAAASFALTGKRSVTIQFKVHSVGF